MEETVGHSLPAPYLAAAFALARMLLGAGFPHAHLILHAQFVVLVQCGQDHSRLLGPGKMSGFFPSLAHLAFLSPLCAIRCALW